MFAEERGGRTERCELWPEAEANGVKFLPTTWPVGQVVKTAASHAVNIGSNPVRVTTSKQAADHSLPHKCESSIPPLLFLSDFQTLRWFENRVQEA